MTYETITVEVTNGVAWVTLNRPDDANVLNLAMTKDLSAASMSLAARPEVRAVVITGTGRFFCAGGDLGTFRAAGDEVAAVVLEMTMHLHAAVSRFARMDAPVIAAVNGVAAGGGFSLAIGCDLIYAADGASFSSMYTAAGLSPDGSSSYFLGRAIGDRRAMEMFLTNRRLSASEAMEWGLINAVVSADDLLNTVRAVAEDFAIGPTKAYGSVKTLVRSSSTESLESQMEAESQHIARNASGADGREGIDAFLAKRAPEFKGRS
jgi:2-(1,2-epoxy-1,2-dihydrophenyl)acetyl-CoA isomerase